MTERKKIMHTEQVISQMKQMRLSVMAESFQVRMKNGDHNDLSHEEFVALLVEDEYNARQNRKLARMIGRANFKPEQACIEDIDYKAARGFQKNDIMQFTTITWINNAQNLIVTGPTGSGKTYLAEAIAYQAIKMGFPAVKIRYRLLFEEIHNAKGTGLYLKFLKKLSVVKVLIIDDFVMHPIQQADLGDLMDIIEEKEQTGSIIVTTQFPIDKWHLKLPDPTVADAICDRLVHGAIKINLKGDSMRKNKEKSKTK
jgi:DNA replication protein DnaC